MSINELDNAFRTKKQAREAGFLTRDQWFKKYRVPLQGTIGISFRGDEYFTEDQTEELFSRSKGQKEIGPLKPATEAVGVKRFRTVRFPVYRESDFVFEPKVVRRIAPAQTVDLIEAIRKVLDTASKFTVAAENSQKKNNRKRSRGFRSRARKLTELADLGIRRAIILEQVAYGGKRGGIHRYVVDGIEFRTRVTPPEWFSTTANLTRETVEQYRTKRPKVRLVDAVHTLEPFRDDPMLEW